MGYPWSAGEKLLATELNNIVSFGGDGSDGILNVTSGTETLDADSANVLIKQYESINISAGATLTIENPGDNGTILILKCTSNVTIAGDIIMTGMGAQKGVIGYGIMDDVTDHFGGDGGNAGDNPGTAGASGTIFSNLYQYTTRLGSIFQKSLIIATGSGGGDGGGDNVGAGGGDGGRGGGSLIVECAGALDFSGGINISGENGSDGADNTGGQSAGGGGGGSCGMSVILYNFLTANTGTVTQKGGDGGDGGDSTGANGSKDGGGSGGGAGSMVAGAIGVVGGAINGVNGNNGSGGSGASGGSGCGDGAAGGVAETGGTGGTGIAATDHSLIIENTEF